MQVGGNNMAARTIAENRHNRRRVIENKKRILRGVHAQYPFGDAAFMFCKHEGQLSKGKIHCSCPMCSAKFNKHPNIRDTKKIEFMKKEERLWKSYGLAV